MHTNISHITIVKFETDLDRQCHCASVRRLIYCNCFLLDITYLSRTLFAWRRSFSRTSLCVGSIFILSASSALEQLTYRIYFMYHIYELVLILTTITGTK